MSTIIVGAIIGLVLIWAFIKTKESFTNQQCPGCSGGCSKKKQAACETLVKIDGDLTSS